MTQFPDAAATSVPYKPTFKPYVPDANDTKFVVDFVLEEVSTEEEAAAPAAAVDADVVSVAENDTMLALATMISEKLNFVEMGESATKYINQLSNNSLVNLVVIFGLPIITAVLSVMGAGPLAIATTASRNRMTELDAQLPPGGFDEYLRWKRELTMQAGKCTARRQPGRLDAYRK